MTLDEAIKESNKLKEEFFEIFDEQEHKAIQLGIEALERLEEVRDILDTNLVKSLLPSETE